MPAVTHNSTGAGTTNNWGTPANVAADDAAVATRQIVRNAANTAYWAVAAFTEAEVPTGSTINSVTIGVRARVTAADANVTMPRAFMLGTTLTGTTTSTGNPTTVTETLYTATVAALTVANLQNSTLQIRTIDNSSTSGPPIIQIDHMYLTVDYTAPAGTPVRYRRVGSYR